MDKQAKINIIAEPNIIDDNFLDIIGAEFKFDHEKGLAEWLKNSVDAYITTGIPDSEQNVIIRLTDGNHNDATFEFIDFVGTSHLEIDKGFKRWGDPKAASRGSDKAVYGGHGNGGKFYMRQMFDSSSFTTYRDGHLTIFGFNENRKYGYAEKYKNKEIKPEEALRLAKINTIIFPPGIREAILSGKTGFTVVRGVGPSGMKNKIKVERLINRFKNHPQSRRIISRINVWLAQGKVKEYSKLEPDPISPLRGFEEPRTIDIPEELPVIEDGEKITVRMTDEKYPSGKLILKTSEEAFGKGSHAADLNRIDIIGKIGTIGSYQLFEIGVKVFPQASFLYGECECPILEDPNMDAVRNDRSKLHENQRSKALLGWIRDRVDEMASEIASKEKAEQESDRKRISAAYNDYLNRWKDRFMMKILGDLFKSGGTADTSGAADDGQRRKTLEPPMNGFSFSFPVAEIFVNEIENLTLKAIVPKPIPIGTIISLKSTNPEIELSQSEVTITSNLLRVIASGETIAVLNITVVGKRIGAEGKIIASAGKHTAEISLRVIEAVGSGKNKKPKLPQVLLSGTDPDPLGIDTSGTVILTERDPLVYQRPQDVDEGIYWINTQSPIANAILKRDPNREHSVRWRDFLFQRYVDIFVKEAIYELQKRDPEGFRAERIDSDIFDGLLQRIHATALGDLSSFFFDEEFDPMNPEPDKLI